MLVVDNDCEDLLCLFWPRKPIKEICHASHVSRKVVRKVVGSDTTAFRCERKKQTFSKIGPWRERLGALFPKNDEKAS